MIISENSENPRTPPSVGPTSTLTLEGGGADLTDFPKVDKDLYSVNNAGVLIGSTGADTRVSNGTDQFTLPGLPVAISSPSDTTTPLVILTQTHYYSQKKNPESGDLLPADKAANFDATPFKKLSTLAAWADVILTDMSDDGSLIVGHGNLHNLDAAGNRTTLIGKRGFLLLPVEVKEVSFTGAKYHELIKDDISVTYSAPHWVDKDGNGNPTDTADGEKDYSVAYTRNTKPSIGAKFSIHGLPNNLAIKLRAKGSDGIEIPETAAQINGNDVSLPITSSSTNWPNTIKFYDRSDPNKAFEIDWEIRVGDGNWAQVATTRHQVYLTLDDPTTTLRQETLFFLGSKNADGQNDDKIAFTKIWSDFTDLDVRNVSGLKIKYWEAKAIQDAGNPNLGPYSTEYLLKNNDGACGAWGRFLRDISNIQGIAAKRASLEMKQLTFDPGDGYGVKANDPVSFYVKDWKIENMFPVRLSHTPGQSNTSPPDVFSSLGHCVSHFDGKIYDPSYGKSYPDAKSWAHGSVSVVDYRVDEKVASDPDDDVVTSIYLPDNPNLEPFNLIID